MNYRKNFAIFLTLMFALTAFCSAASAQTDEAVVLRFGQKPGNIAIYRLSLRGVTTTSIGDMDQKIDVDTEMYISQACEKSEKGKIAIVTSIDSGKSNINGDVTVPQNVGSRFHVIMEPSGKILESSQDQAGETSQMQIVFPEKPLKVGDSWENSIPIQNGRLNLKATYKLEGYDQVNGRKCAKISSNVISLDGGKPTDRTYMGMKASGVIFFDMAAGIIVKNVVTSFMDVKMVSSFGTEEQSILTKMFMTMTMELKN